MEGGGARRWRPYAVVLLGELSDVKLVVRVGGRDFDGVENEGSIEGELNLAEGDGRVVAVEA